MKKTKLLIPVFGVGAIAAAVVPFVTSCSDTYTLSWKPGDVDPTYEPMRSTKSVYTVEEATNEYFNNVNKEILAKEIILDDINYEWPVKEKVGRAGKNIFSEIKVQTAMNKPDHKISLKIDIEAQNDRKTRKSTYHVECENVEFIATRLWDISNPVLLNPNIVAPKILVYVKEAYEIYWGWIWDVFTEDQMTRAVEKALVLADSLSRDTSWNFKIVEQLEEDHIKEIVNTKINYSNIYEYVDNIFQPDVPEGLDPILSLVNFSINSYFLSNIKINLEY